MVFYLNSYELSLTYHIGSHSVNYLPHDTSEQPDRPLVLSIIKTRLVVSFCHCTLCTLSHVILSPQSVVQLSLFFTQVWEYQHTDSRICLQIYRVRQIKVIPCCVLLISQQLTGLFSRKFAQLVIIPIYV